MASAPATPKIDEDALKRLGYAVTRFRDGRACIVWNEDEHWLGAGADDDGALAHAVTQMFPSRIARDAVAFALSGALGAMPAAPAIQQTQLRVVRPAVAPKPRAPDADMTKLDELAARVAQGADSLARLAPDLQRMTMFTWLARARDLEDRWPSDPRVSERVTEIAARLGGYAKAYWPGTVQALRVGTMPAESLFGLMRSSELRGLVPQSWADAAEIVEGALAKRMAAPEFDGGYRDAEHAQGGGAEKLVTEAAKVIDSVLGGGGTHRVLPAVLPQLVDAAKKLRRVRRSAKDGSRWGSLVGQLRALAAHDDQARAALREVLDPEHVPPTGWGEPPKPVAPNKPPTPVTPAADAAEAETLLGKARTMQALAKAIAASHRVLSADAIAAKLDARRDDVARIGEAMMPDDDARTALAAVKARLADVPDAADG